MEGEERDRKWLKMIEIDTEEDKSVCEKKHFFQIMKNKRH